MRSSRKPGCPTNLGGHNTSEKDDVTMEYRKPEIVSQANSLDAVRSGTQKVAPPIESAGSLIEVTVNAYEADE